jgi:hypothetical protein
MVDNHRVVLEFASGNITLECSERDWYEVFLTFDGVETPLGAERFGSLARHLVGFLGSPQPDWKWILSLSELHHSAYGRAAVNGGVQVLVQDAEAKAIAKINVTQVERQTWLRLLEPLL